MRLVQPFFYMCMDFTESICLMYETSLETLCVFNLSLVAPLFILLRRKKYFCAYKVRKSFESALELETYILATKKKKRDSEKSSEHFSK